jgi:hypothetical protein
MSSQLFSNQIWNVPDMSSQLFSNQIWNSRTKYGRAISSENRELKIITLAWTRRRPGDATGARTDEREGPRGGTAIQIRRCSGLAGTGRPRRLLPHDHGIGFKLEATNSVPRAECRCRRIGAGLQAWSLADVLVMKVAPASLGVKQSLDISGTIGGNW